MFSGTTHRVRVSREAKRITSLSFESTSEGSGEQENAHNRVRLVLVRLAEVSQR